MSKTGSLAMAKVMAHCGGNPAEAVAYVVQAIDQDPADPEPYALLAEIDHREPPGTLPEFAAAAYLSFLDGEMDRAAQMLGSVIGFRPRTAWTSAPWFGDERFVGAVTAAGLGEACLNITDYGPDLDSDAARERLAPWLRLIDAVCEREPAPDAMARMAILLRACGLTDASLALCDRADAIEPVMFTEVVRAGTWRRLGERGRTAAAFRRALTLDPANWSLYLDLADLEAENGDFATAAALVGQGLEHEPEDVTLRAAGAAYRARAEGSVADLDLLLELAPELPHAGYRNGLIDHALGTPGLPADRVAAAHRVQAAAD